MKVLKIKNTNLLPIVNPYGVTESCQVNFVSDKVFITTSEVKHHVILFINQIGKSFIIYGYPFDKEIRLSTVCGYNSTHFYFGLEYGYISVSTDLQMKYYPNENLYNIKDFIITSAAYYIDNTFVKIDSNLTFIGYNEGIITFYNTDTCSNVMVNVLQKYTPENNIKYFIYDKESRLVPVQGSITADVAGTVGVIDLNILGKYTIFTTHVIHNGKTIYMTKEPICNFSMYTIYNGGVAPAFIFSFHKNTTVYHDIINGDLRIFESNLITVMNGFVITNKNIYNRDMTNIQFDMSGCKFSAQTEKLGRYFIKYKKNNKSYYIEIGNTKSCFKPLADAPIPLDI